MITPKHTPREIEFEFGYDGKLLWPIGSPVTSVRERILFREVTPQDAKFREAFEAMERALLQVNEYTLTRSPPDIDLIVEKALQKAQEAKNE